MEPGGKFGSLFKRKLFDGGLDLVDAHNLNNIQKRPFTATCERYDGGRSSEDRDRRSEVGRPWNNHGSDVIAGFLNLIQRRIDLPGVQIDKAQRPLRKPELSVSREFHVQREFGGEVS